MKALIVRGGWDGHTPVESTDLMAPLMEERGFEVEISDSLDSYTDAEKMNALSLVVQCVTMSDLSGEQERGLLDAVKSGIGFAGWHGGAIDSFRPNTEYHWMTGGQWVAHPGNCIPSYEVTIVDTEHEITSGVEPFTLSDTEQYYCHTDPGNHVLCTTTFSGEHGETSLYPAGMVMPYAWTRRYGAGKVFIAAWGHTYKEFDGPEAREIVLRGMTWAAATSRK
jgi:type 1 glutamine amidotransferase